MTKSSKRRFLKAGMALGAMAVVASIAVVLKPGPSHRAPAASKPPSASTPVSPASTSDRALSPPSPAAAVSASIPAAKPAVPSKHGEDAVVRSGEALGESLAARPLATPNWSAPERLTFSAFKALRRRFRELRDFSSDDIFRLHGAAVEMRGALMPIDPVPKSGELARFWLANPVVVMAGCVFCNPPTMADLMYVETPADAPLVVDRERLYRSVEYATLIGRFELGPGKSEDGVEYLFHMTMRERLE